MQLVQKLTEDSYSAFEVLYNRYKAKIYYFIVDISNGNYYMAEEIVQMVFIKIWEVRHELTLVNSFSPYLYTMTKNSFLNQVAKKAREQLLKEQTCATALQEQTVDNEAELNILIETIEQIIDQLPPARQHVYRLRYLKHLSQKEIAGQLNISENTVEAHIRQSNEYLKKMLHSKYGVFLNTWTILLLLIQIGK